MGLRSGGNLFRDSTEQIARGPISMRLETIIDVKISLQELEIISLLCFLAPSVPLFCGAPVPTAHGVLGLIPREMSQMRDLP